MTDPAGPFKVILSSVEESWNSRLRSEVSRVFQIDDETASNIVSAIPIVVLDGLDARVAGIVRERMRGLVEAGCRVVTTDDPADTIPRVNWPETPEIARIPPEEARQVVTVHEGASSSRDAVSKSPPLASFSCPGCGQVFNVSGATRSSDGARDQVGALGQPGASAPSGGMPGNGGGREGVELSPRSPGVSGGREPARAQATSETAAARVETAPAKNETAARTDAAATPHRGKNGTEKSAKPTAEAAEPGARLAGDEWLDPPLSTKPARPSGGAGGMESHRAAEPAKPAAEKPVAAPKPAEAPARAPVPAEEGPITRATPARSTPAPAQVAAAAPAPPPKKTPSLLDDPLLAAKRFDTTPAVGNSLPEPGVLATSEPTTLVARPITSRFSRSVAQPAGANAPAAPPAPPPTPRPSQPVVSTTASRAASPQPAGPTQGTGRFAAPPPPSPGTQRFGSAASTAPIPPPSKFAALDSTKSDLKPPISAGPPREEDELDVHFDEASDIAAVEKLGTKKPGKKGDDDAPSGVDEDADNLDRLLEEDAPPPSSSTKKAAPKPAAKANPAPSGDEDLDDLVPFDDMESSRGSGTRAPRAKVEDSSDGSFAGGNLDDLLDGPPQATVKDPSQSSKGGKKPLPGEGGKGRAAPPSVPLDEEEEPELLLDDEEPPKKPAAKKPAPARGGREAAEPPPRGGKPKLDDSADDDPAESVDDDELDVFADSGDRPALKPEKGKPAGKSKLPRDSGFADALDLFEAEDEEPVVSGDGDAEEVPEIKPLDLASDVQGVPAKGGKKKPEMPFDKPSSSAILEPLDPVEAMAILKTHKNEDADPSGMDTRPTKRPADADSLEPLDPNDALAILGSPDERGKGGKAPPRKPARQRNGRTSDASKLVPLSASDEDFAFLEEGKGQKAGKATDPFARAKKPPGGGGRESSDPPARGQDRSAPPPGRREPPAKPARDPLESDSDSPTLRAAPAAKRSGDSVPSKSAASKAPPKRSGGAVPEGAGDCGLVLPRISSDEKKEKAAEIIAEIKGIGVDEAMKLTERTIIPVLAGVARDVAEFHKEKFERNKISARVTTRQKEK